MSNEAGGLRGRVSRPPIEHDHKRLRTQLSVLAQRTVLVCAAVLTTVSQTAVADECTKAGDPTPVAIVSQPEWDAELSNGLSAVRTSQDLVNALEISDERLQKIFLHGLENSSGRVLFLDISSSTTISEVRMRICSSESCLHRTVNFDASARSCFKNYQAESFIYFGARRVVPRGSLDIELVIENPDSSAWFDSFFR